MTSILQNDLHWGRESMHVRGNPNLLGRALELIGIVPHSGFKFSQLEMSE